MAVLTVSREIGSGGDAIAKKVAEKCGWDLLDNEGFAAAAQTYGYVRAELEKVDERGPGLIERFFRDRQLVYLDIMRAIVFESAIKNNIVILGRGSGILLKGIPGVFRVRFIASDKVRQRRLVDQEGIFRFDGGGVHKTQRPGAALLYQILFRRHVGVSLQL